jgi:hypothetical protein
MTLAEAMQAAWKQVLVDNLAEVEIEGRRLRVTRTRSAGLRIVSFVYQEFGIDGIEQNPEKTSQWAQLAREGKRIMQFRCDNRFVANVCEGKLLRYPAWKAKGLPD